MTNWRGLEPEEERALGLAAEGLRFDAIAAALNLKEAYVRQRLFRAIYDKLDVHSLHGATALYGNYLGLHGNFLSRQPMGSQGTRFGHFFVPGIIITPDIPRSRDVTCTVNDEPFQPPPEFAANLESLRRQSVEEAQAQHRIVYENAAGILVVDSLDPHHEFYCPLTMRLRRIMYFTDMAIHRNLTDELRAKYLDDPRYLQSARLPYVLVVSLHVIAGHPPSLIILKRATNLAFGRGSYASTSGGTADGGFDVAYDAAAGEYRFDWVSALHREFSEERYGAITVDAFRRSLVPLGLIFEFEQLTYSLHGYIECPGVMVKTILDNIPRAFEGKSEALEWPRGRGDISRIRRVCAHLKHNQWNPAELLGIVLLLKKQLQLPDGMVEDMLAGRDRD